jgi:hypothetical protein
MADPIALAIDGPAGLITQILTDQGNVNAFGVPVSAAGVFSTFAIFRPGAPTAAPAYATLAEILPLIAAADGAFTLYIDSSLAPAEIPAGTVLDGRDLLTIAPARGPVGGTAMTLTIDDGGQILNPIGFVGQIDVASATTTIPALVVNNTNEGIFLQFGARLLLLAAATRAFLDVIPGPTNLVAFNLDFASSFSSAAPGIPFANLTAAGSVFSTFYARMTPFSQPQTGAVAGVVGSTYVFTYDASVAVPSLPAFFGTLIKFQIDNGLVTESLIEFTQATYVASGGIAISSTYPAYQAGALPNARMLGADIEVVTPLASPAMTASTAQVRDAFTGHGWTGVADTFAGGTGFIAPLPTTLQLDAASATHLPNLLQTITNDTFANVTAGHVRSRIVITANPRPSP